MLVCCCYCAKKAKRDGPARMESHEVGRRVRDSGGRRAMRRMRPPPQRPMGARACVSGRSAGATRATRRAAPPRAPHYPHFQRFQGHGSRLRRPAVPHLSDLGLGRIFCLPAPNDQVTGARAGPGGASCGGGAEVLPRRKNWIGARAALSRARRHRMGPAHLENHRAEVVILRRRDARHGCHRVFCRTCRW